MLSPYRQVVESDEFVVYEFKTIYLYAMYGILAVIAGGYFGGISLLSTVGTMLMVLYFLFVSTRYMKLNGSIKRAAKTASVEMSGSKTSFSNPLRVKIRKEFI